MVGNFRYLSSRHKAANFNTIGKSTDKSKSADADADTTLFDLETLMMNPIGKQSIWHKIYNGPELKEDSYTVFTKERIQYIDQLPLKFQNLRDKYKKIIMVIYYLISILLFSKMINFVLFKEPYYYGPSISNASEKWQKYPVYSIPCGQSSLIWDGSDKCGHLANNCLDSFINKEWIFVKCPIFCDSAGQAYSPITVALSKIQYEPYLIRSKNLDEHDNIIWRGDTFPCAAAMSMGLISSANGGTILLELDDEFNSIPVVNTHDKAKFEAKGRSKSKGRDKFELSKRNDDAYGKSFDSLFPASFKIHKIDEKYLFNFKDYRIYFIWNIVLLILPSLLFSTSIAFGTTCLYLFLFVGLIFDPPVIVSHIENSFAGLNSGWNLISIIIKRFTTFIWLLFGIWHLIASYIFGKSDNNSQSAGLIPRVVFLLSLLPTTLFNATFDRLPIDRLIWSDIVKQPGGPFALAFILSLITIGSILQAFKIWKAGWLLKAIYFYLSSIIAFIWISFGAGGILTNNSSNKPSLLLRFHHWIIGLFLLPGTKTKWIGSFSLFGLLLGLIINGGARWDWDSILETSEGINRDQNRDDVPQPVDLIFKNKKFKILMNDIIDENDVSSTLSTLDNTGKFIWMLNDIEIFTSDNNTLNLNVIENYVQLLVKTDLDDFDFILPLYIRACYEVDERKSQWIAGKLWWPNGEWEGAALI